MNARLFLTVGITLGLGLLTNSAQAQSFSFSVGHHGHHHRGHHGHHHGWHYDHCWHDPFWYGPHYDYVYVAPPPVVRREIRYVQPVERVVETRVETPRVSAATIPAAGPVYASSAVKIWNTNGQRVPVGFLADGRQVSLSDGQSHTLYGSGSRTIEFDRGGDFGTARLELTGGEYEFVVTSRGWDLVRRSESAKTAARPVTPKNELPGAAVQR